MITSNAKALITTVAILGSVFGFFIFGWLPYYFIDGWYDVQRGGVLQGFQFGGSSGLFFFALGGIFGAPTCSVFPTVGLLYLKHRLKIRNTMMQPAILYVSTYLSGFVCLIVFLFLSSFYSFHSFGHRSPEYEEILPISGVLIEIFGVAFTVVINCYKIDWILEK
jgi:hypothetical protein